MRLLYIIDSLDQGGAEQSLVDLAPHLAEEGVDLTIAVLRPGGMLEPRAHSAKAKIVLDTDMSISNALPCRISVYEEAGRVKVSMLQPTALLALFGRPELQSVAKEVEETMIRIIDTA